MIFRSKADNIQEAKLPSEHRDDTASAVRALLHWGLVYLGAAVISLFITNTASDMPLSDLPWIAAMIVPRLMTLLLITLPAQLLPYRRSCTLVLIALWYVWLGVSYGTVLNAILMVLLLAISAAACFFLLEWKKDPAALTATPESRRYVAEIYALLLLSVLVIFLLEFMQTRSTLRPFSTMLGDPDVFACNLLYFTALGSIVVWIPKPRFTGIFYLLIWFTLALISLFKSLNTYEPVLLLDVFSLRDAIPAAVNILGIPGLIAIGVGIVAVIVLIIFLAKKEKSRPFRMPVFISCLAYAAVAFAGVVCASHLPNIKYETSLPKEAYDHNGFVYCFVTYAFDSLVTEPKGYDEPTVQSIQHEVDAAFAASDDVHAAVQNIVVIQMESFVDPYWIEGASFERDPMPFIHSLAETYSCGAVNVPVFGGQTVKSEFEFLSGMNLSNLPFGYSPYVLHVNSTPIDSFPRYLRSIGFSATAIHDFQGEFFKRNLVYRNMGFERFIPYEFMSGVEKKEGSIWADDDILLTQMQKVVEQSDTEKNFIFAVSVQMHGGYPVLSEEDYPMEVYGVESRSLEGRLAYYVGQLEQFDATIHAICDYFEALGEPTMILMYSDHLPSLCLDAPGFTDENRFTTPFYTWNNMGLVKQNDKNPELYMLSTELCHALSMDGSFMNRFHTLYGDQETYEDNLKIIQYYKLFEEYNTTDFGNPDYTLGLEEQTITSIEADASAPGDYIIHGTALTDDTYLCVNGRLYNMVYVDEHTMRLQDYTRGFSDTDQITLRVIGAKYGSVLRESTPYEGGFHAS